MLPWHLNPSPWRRSCDRCDGWVGVFQGSFGVGGFGLGQNKGCVNWRNHVLHHVSLDFFEFFLGFLLELDSNS